MKPCPFCAEQIQDAAVKCPCCGEFLDGRTRRAPTPAAMALPASWFGYEYKSKLNIAGVPLIHVTSGIDPRTMRPRVARGVVAIGNVAIGALAVGGAAFGGIALGGVGVGLLALGGLAIGGIAFGGCALGATLAVGGAAFSLRYAIGGLAIAPHVIGSGHEDPVLVEKLKTWVPAITNMIRGTGGR